MQCKPIGIFLSLVACLSTPAVSGAAQPYPTKPIRMVVPYPPGGSADAAARPIAQMLSERLGQSVLIDNRGGATGMIGAGIVAKAAPDGHTLLVSGSSEVALNVTLYERMAYDPVRDLAPVTLVAEMPTILVSHPSLPARSVNEYAALARARPGVLSYASGGAGTPMHFAGELMRIRLRIVLTHVPYKGTGPAVTELLGGQVPSGFVALVSAVSHIKAGKLHGIAVSSARRSSVLPQIPALSESLPGFDITQWNGVWVPAGTPKEVIARLNAEIVRIVRSEDFVLRMRELGSEARGTSASELAVFQKDEIEKYWRIVRDAGIVLN